MLRTQDSKTQFAPRLKTLRLKTLDPGRAGRYVVSYSVAGCSVAGCSVAGCSVVMSQCGGWVQGRCESGWAASRACIVSQLEIRFRGLCGTLELQRWPHTSDACGMLPDGCVRHGCLLVCSLGTLELEGALLLELTLTTICLGLDGHHLTPRDHGSHALAGAASQTFRGARRSHKKLPPSGGGLWYSR